MNEIVNNNYSIREYGERDSKIITTALKNTVNEIVNNNNYIREYGEDMLNKL